MSSMEIDLRASKVSVQKEELNVWLKDGTAISVPLSWSRRLLQASPGQRQHFRLIGGGEGIHWPDIDEDLSVSGLLAEIERRRLTALSVPSSQVGFALSQPLEGKFAFHISPSPTGSFPAPVPLLCRKGRKGRKPARKILFLRSVADKIQGGMNVPLLTGPRSNRQA
jgi:hypothetical protein